MFNPDTFIGASAPFGKSMLSSYRMTADAYIGKVFYIAFHTPTDLTPWLPAPLKPVDPHSAFLKIYHLTRNPVGESSRKMGYNAYHEVCVTVLARTDDDPTPRHFNLGMWLDRDWAIYKAREILGWPKKMGEIEVVWPILPPEGSKYESLGRRPTFGAKISRYGSPIIEVEGTVDPDLEPAEIPPLNGFYSVRHLVAPDGDPRHRIRQLLRIDTQSGWASAPVFAECKVKFSSCGDEELGLLGNVSVTSCALRDVGWTLPAFPATVLDEDLDFSPDYD